MKWVVNFGMLLSSFITFVSWGSVYNLPSSDSRLIGEQVIHKAIKGDYFQALAENYNVGFFALLAANPNVDPFLLEPGSDIVIPKQMLLPFGKREGIVINLAEMRLYYYPKGENLVYVFPVGIGREGLETPHLTSTIGEKRKDPTWRPTQEMRARYFAEHGKEMVKEVPAGPNNPFGKYALRIGTSEYLLHGTNKRFGIGMRASSGCIRLYDNDIEWLYNNIPIGTLIRILEQPIKMSYEHDGKKIELHSPLTPEGGGEVKLVMTKAVKHFIGNNVQMLKKVSLLLANPEGVVVSLN
ncbi:MULTISPECIES: L,D-transpeptidase family protein [unclassified Colwellia]|uniref:L,D-transpeptidase family protein n=1 Tax=unclassified Colwellia TaxID=196834 RepID=UPI0015F60554|nr:MULTISPECIES: L,D-transpeptidase family protein [unclassified Colwellia]MBA6233468.1 L,D-transpeptidase family protein [Colwellia sp. MB02u-7]MBA6236558.1 L,D-transpeptidase family protein [Colwellia sp. MB02u-11]MBA6298043.1 L,D-transpeptidase family protein [Colwellia sp. MB3u-22]MBA6312133.1 L,D-transpeptidase family protein [Colwellia sp. MB3u-64]